MELRRDNGAPHHLFGGAVLELCFTMPWNPGEETMRQGYSEDSYDLHMLALRYLEMPTWRYPGPSGCIWSGAWERAM